MPDYTTIPTSEREEVLKEIESTLVQSPGLDASDRETLLRHFGDALAAPQSGTEGQTGPSRAQWLETLEMLRQSFILTHAECDQLVREFDAQMSRLQDAKLARALELARVSEKGGPVAAREWLGRT